MLEIISIALVEKMTRAKENQREAGGAVKDKLPKAEKTATREELGKIAGWGDHSGLCGFCENTKTERPLDTRKETAKLANTSSHKVREVDTVLKHGTTEQVKRLRSVWRAVKISIALRTIYLRALLKIQ